MHSSPSQKAFREDPKKYTEGIHFVGKWSFDVFAP